jgi:ribosomal protein L16 Arg81 hydroxylase
MTHRATAESSFSPEWRRWIAANKMAGFDDQVLIDAMVSEGFPGWLARREIDSVVADPCYQAGDAMAQRLRKLQSLLSVTRELRELAPSQRFGRIERRSNLSREEFLDRYYSANCPVILLGLMNDWKARSRWTPDYLKTACGNEMVEIMSGRESDPRYEVNSTAHKTTCRFAEYVDMVSGSVRTNDFYLVANNNLLAREGMKCLYEDIVAFPEYMDPESRDGCVFFWFGPAGTVTPLHHDLLNIFMAQVRGRKRITLIAPDQTPSLYNDTSVFSEVDPVNPDYETFPLFRDVKATTFVLRPGEALFIPVGWWHHVEALDLSITVSMSNFLFPNDYKWKLPDIPRDRPCNL